MGPWEASVCVRGSGSREEENCSLVTAREVSPRLQAMFLITNVLRPASPGTFTQSRRRRSSLVFLPSGNSTSPASREPPLPKPREINRKSPGRKSLPRSPKSQQPCWAVHCKHLNVCEHLSPCRRGRQPSLTRCCLHAPRAEDHRAVLHVQRHAALQGTIFNTL